MEKPLGRRFVEDAKANKCSRSLAMVLEKADASKYRRWPIRSPPLHQKYGSDECSEDVPAWHLHTARSISHRMEVRSITYDLSKNISERPQHRA